MNEEETTQDTIDLEAGAMGLNDLAYIIHKRNNRWWYTSDGKFIDRNKGELIALIHSEISECLEGVRKDCMDTHLPERKMEEVEIADALIRIFDYAGAFKLDITGALLEKLEYNDHREDHKHETRERDGGKKF